MSKMNRGWLAVAAALAVGASSVARAGGDNSMNPMYGDSYAALEGNGHNVGTQGIAPEGAYAAHEMDGQTTPLMDQMHRTAMNLQTSTSSEPRATTAAPASATTAAPATTASPASTMDLTGSTSAPSAAGPVIATPGSNQGTTSAPESSSQSGMNNGYRISPVNPKGQAPTIMGPGG
jgi:hypothetical protein